MMATNDAYHLELAILREKHVAGYFNEADYLNQCEELQNAEFAAIANQNPRHCSWCKSVMSEGNPALPISHGCCEKCYQVQVEQIEAIQAGKR